MKDAADNKTLDLLPVPKKRGRPSTGKAKTAAERMRELRQRSRQQITARYHEMTLTALYDMLRHAVSNGAVSMCDGVCEELKSRSRLARDLRNAFQQLAQEPAHHPLKL